MLLIMANQLVAILKPIVVSVGLSACRTREGTIALSAHRDSDRVLMEVSEEECLQFAQGLIKLCQDDDSN
jgi:hypothetical protein